MFLGRSVPSVDFLQRLIEKVLFKPHRERELHKLIGLGSSHEGRALDLRRHVAVERDHALGGP